MVEAETAGGYGQFRLLAIMDDLGPALPVAAGRPALPSEPPASVRVLAIAFWVQAAAYAIGALVGLVAYFARGANHFGLGAYAMLRTHPITMIVVGAAVAGVLVWWAHRLPARPTGLRSRMRTIEILLIVDTAISFLAGVFPVWSVVGLLAAVAALSFLGADDTTDYLL